MTVTTYEAAVGSQRIDLPLVPVADDVAIALLITVDVSLAFLAQAGVELADALRATKPDIIVTAATLGIPVAREVAGALGHDEYVVLHKTPKIHLADALTEPLRSITTDADQRFRLDRARLSLIEGRRVAFVDDVISTGGSTAAALRLIRRGGGEVVSIGTLLAESTAWHDTLGPDADLVTALGTIPIFGRDSARHWVPR